MLHGNCVRALTPLSLSLLITKSQRPVLHFANRKRSYPEIFHSTEFFHCWNSVMSPRRGHEQGKNLFPMSPLGWVDKLMLFIANQYSFHLPPSKLPNSLKTQVFSSGTSPWVGRPLSHSSLHTQKQAQNLEYGRQDTFRWTEEEGHWKQWHDHFQQFISLSERRVVAGWKWELRRQCRKRQIVKITSYWHSCWSA